MELEHDTVNPSCPGIQDHQHDNDHEHNDHEHNDHQHNDHHLHPDEHHGDHGDGPNQDASFGGMGFWGDVIL